MAAIGPFYPTLQESTLVAEGLNLGDGFGVYNNTDLSFMKFKTLVGQNGVTLTATLETITISAAGGGNFDPAGNYETTGTWVNHGSWTFDGPVVLPNTSVLTLEGPTLASKMVSDGSGSSLEVTYTSAQIIFEGTPTDLAGLSGDANSSFTWGGPAVLSGSLDIDGADWSLLNPPTAVTAFSLYWDPSLKKVSVGAAGSGSGWSTAGSNTGAGLVFGTSDLNGWDYHVNGAVVGSVDSTGKFEWASSFAVTAPDTIIIRSGGAAAPPPYTPGSFVVNSAALVSTVAIGRNQMSSSGSDCWIVANGEAKLEGATISINGSGGNTGPDGANVWIHSDAGDMRIESEVGQLTVIGGAVLTMNGDETRLQANNTLFLGAPTPAPGVGIQLIKPTNLIKMFATGGYSMSGITAITPTAGSFTNVPPVGWEVMIVNTTSGDIGRFPSN